MTVYAALAASD